MRLVVASTSAHKVEELGRMVADLVDEGRLEIRSLSDLAAAGTEIPEVEEDAPDFAGNAEKKARAYAELTGDWVMADDSGLVVDALGGQPGVYSARYAGVEGAGRDAANNAKLLEALEGVPDEARTARFVCALALVAPDGRIFRVEGKCEGRIAHAPRGEGGFGYDPLFLSLEPGIEGDRTHGELDPEEKDGVSHRGRALRAIRPILEEVARIDR